MKPLRLLLAALALLAVPAQSAFAYVGFGVSFGPYYGYWPGPYYYRPYYAPRFAYPAPYYWGPRAYYAYGYPPYPPPPRYAYAYPPPPPPQRAPERPRAEKPAPQASIAPPQRFEKVTLSATELFEFDQFQLREPQPKLDEIAHALSENPGISSVTITGYTDRLGSEDYNLALSKRRAESVKMYLMRKGIDGKRLNIVGKGEANPIAHCDQKDEAALIKCLEPNRRVEVEQITVERKVGPKG